MSLLEVRCDTQCSVGVFVLLKAVSFQSFMFHFDSTLFPPTVAPEIRLGHVCLIVDSLQQVAPAAAAGFQSFGGYFISAYLRLKC